ncbi:ABC transporter permease subunit [Solibacillus sp. CAU 1738]|uniref:ABC transporter permease subunit n=1 Tax=Solibacillus sp. CAU 1738 TaxID=3140363 RepID=UPI0032603844
MTQFNVLLIKEFLECWRSFKLLWIPLVFVFLGVSDPLLNYYLEDILAAVGNMPEGFQMMFPELKPADLLLASTGQFQLIGLIVLVSAFIGSISRERANGTATLMYVRPVSATAMFMSKWIMASVVGIVSATLGYAGSMYYTSILYGSVAVSDFLAMLCTYFVWIIFVMAITVSMSAAFHTGVAAAIAIIILPIGLLIDQVIGSFWAWTPWKLANYGVEFVAGTVDTGDYRATLIITLVLIVMFMLFGIWSTKRNWQLTKV